MKERIAVLLAIYLLLHGCASITTPQGGPKDKTPPTLINAIPTNNQTNFKGKTIDLTFDEPIKLNNPKEEIIISPSVGKEIEILAKGKRVIITPKNAWKDSTTYSILFREGIQDVTESNPTVSSQLAFSTGAVIDSLKISGTVRHQLTAKVAEKITVALYSQDTFDIFTDVPEYFTKTNKKGAFHIDNIKQGKYYIYAFDDKNKNLKVESRTERYAFLKDKILLTENIDSVELGLVQLDTRPLKVLSIRNVASFTRMRFNKSITDYTVKPDSNLTHSFGDDRTEILLWSPAESDSTQLQVYATDSVANKIDSIFFIKRSFVKTKKENFKMVLGEPTVESETGKFTSVITYNKPATNINFDSLFIKVDTISTIPITKQDIKIDSQIKQIKITKDLDKNLFKTTVPKLTLYAGLGVLYSIEDDTSKTASARVMVLLPDEVGILLLQAQTKEENYIIQLIDKEGKLIRSVSNTPKYAFKNLSPTQYEIRVIIDKNKNGKWDAGNIQTREEPETVVFYRAKDGTTLMPIRANWELGPLIIKF